MVCWKKGDTWVLFCQTATVNRYFGPRLNPLPPGQNYNPISAPSVLELPHVLSVKPAACSSTWVLLHRELPEAPLGGRILDKVSLFCQHFGDIKAFSSLPVWKRPHVFNFLVSSGLLTLFHNSFYTKKKSLSCRRSQAVCWNMWGCWHKSTLTPTIDIILL